jgi:cytochrome c556
LTRSKTFLWAAAAGACLSLSLAAVATGAGNPLQERQAAMKQIGGAMKEAGGLASGKTPWDAAKAKAAMATISSDAEKLHGLFPAGSDQGKTGALPKVWESKADFDKRLTELGKDAAAAGNAADATTFQASFKKLGANCKACHDVYRKPQT